MPQNMNFNPAQNPYWTCSGAQAQSTPPPPPFTPATSPGNINSVNTVNSDVLARIVNRLDSMDKKLSQLDSIQASMTSLTVRLDTIDQKINKVESKIQDVERSREFDSKTMTELVKKHDELEHLISKMKKYEQEQKEKEIGLKEEIQDLKCCSMRDNLLFHKVAEEREENCEQKILKLIEEKFKIDNASTSMKIQRAHRIGAYRTGKTRPIVVKFAFYPDRERVRQAARELKDPDVGVSEQFPREVMERRKKLVPIMLKAREEGKDAYIKVDKLYINRQLYSDSV